MGFDLKTGMIVITKKNKIEIFLESEKVWE